MSRIKTLSAELINCIAAGEIIERPASIVKELVENSLDANATSIEISCSDGGKAEIIVRDNGRGIHPEDLPLAIKSHSTSKISTLQELEMIRSLGFRGEALSAIAGVSEFVIQSKYAHEDTAYEISMKADRQLNSIKPVAHPNGTSVKAKNLFFNLPVRKKFLRRKETELLAIENLVKNLTLSNFEIGFRLLHEEKMLFNFSSAISNQEKENRLKKVLGKAFIDKSLYVEVNATNLSLKGWVGLPVLHRSQTDLQFFYLNGRPIRDKLILHSIRLAYEDFLPAGRNPLYCLYLTCPPNEADVNIHPNKQEVRFREPRLIHHFLYIKLKALLAETTNHAIGPLNRDAEFNDFSPSISFALSTSFEENQHHLSERVDFKLGTFHLMGLTQQRYAVLEHNFGITVIDLSSLFSHIRIQKINKLLHAGNLEQKKMLMPIIFSVNDEKKSWLMERKTLFAELGIQIENFGQNQMIIREVPDFFEFLDCELWINELFEDKTYNKIKKREILLQHIAQNEAKNWISMLIHHKESEKKLTHYLNTMLEEKIIPTFEKKSPFYQQIFLYDHRKK